MKVKIKATGFGATALKDGTIIHFDPSEAAKPEGERDMRKLEAEVDIDDAKRITDLGWGEFDTPDDLPDAERAELGEEVSKLDQPADPEKGKPSQVAPRADRDDPEANAHRLATGGKQPRAKRPSEVAKAAAKAVDKKPAPAPKADAPAGGATPTSEPEQPAQQTGDGQPATGDGGDQQSGSEDDPEAGPTT